MADFADRSLGIGYPGGALLLLACVLGALAGWHFALGTISVRSVRTPKAEFFYWLTITFSQTLGTALGDWAASVSFRANYDSGKIRFWVGGSRIVL